MYISSSFNNPYSITSHSTRSSSVGQARKYTPFQRASSNTYFAKPKPKTKFLSHLTREYNSHRHVRLAVGGVAAQRRGPVKKLVFGRKKAAPIPQISIEIRSGRGSRCGRLGVSPFAVHPDASDQRLRCAMHLWYRTAFWGELRRQVLGACAVGGVLSRKKNALQQQRSSISIIYS